MGQNFSIDINKQSFYLAGQKVTGVAFVTGQKWLKINFGNGYVDAEGTVHIELRPEQARVIAHELLANAATDQVKRIMKQSLGETDGTSRNEDGTHG
jgi:hypothetical protein